MTTPAPPQQQAKQQPPPRQPPPPKAVPPTTVPATLAAMALPLAGLLLTAASAAVVVAALKLRFKASALWWLALLMVLGVVMAYPPQATGVIGPAGAHVSRLNLARRAQYALAAAGRVAAAMLAARSRGDGMLQAGREAVERERKFFQQHLDAMRQRSANAMVIDMQAAEHGPVLGWAAVLDSRTTRECRLANGKNFYADDPPYIGFPGVDVHVGCRCRAVRAWPGAPLLSGRGPRYNRRAAA